jgi:hypothetical protein
MNFEIWMVFGVLRRFGSSLVGDLIGVFFPLFHLVDDEYQETNSLVVCAILNGPGSSLLEIDVGGG